MRIVQERIIQTGVGRLRSGEWRAAVLKEYGERVAKYVPAEIVAAYIAANGAATGANNAGLLFTVIFAACIVCTPVYITRFATTTKEAWTNGVLATLAFIVWAYATGGGLIAYLDWYDPAAGSVILVVFTLVSGAIEPTTKQQPPPGAIMADQS